MVLNLGIFIFFLTVFVFVPNFATRQIRGRRWQIWQKYFQIPPQEDANLATLGPNLWIFILHQTLELEKFKGVDFKLWQWLFKIPVRKYLNKAVFIPNGNIFYFCMNLRILKSSRVLILKIVIVFFKCQQKNTQIQNFFESSKVFF